RRADIGRRDAWGDLVFQLGIDPDDLHAFCALEDWQRVEDRTRRFAAPIPGDEHPFSDPPRPRPGMWYDQDRPTALDCQPIRYVEPFGPWPIRIRLARHDEIRSTGKLHNAGCDPIRIGFVFAPFADQSTTMDCCIEGCLQD